MQVRVIKRKQKNDRVPETGRKLRVSGYARISTDSSDQENSLAAQRMYYTRLIQSNPDWEFAGLYADDGISGTQMKNRDALNRLLDAARRGEVDLILTKSISRVARNTVDCLNLVREMKEIGVGIIFAKESLDTRDSTSEIVISLLSSLAQAESQSISENVKLGIRYRFQEGKPFINCNHFLGYDKRDGRLVINASQAAVVRRIYCMFINGCSADMIAAALTREQVPTGSGGTVWYPSTVRYILQNEKYIGDLRLQKYVVPNFLTHRPKRNTGEADQYYVQNDHEPVIPREVFAIAQSEAARRAAFRTDGQGRRLGGMKYGSRRALQGRMACACGGVMRRTREKLGRWICPGCGSAISEGDARSAVLAAFGMLSAEIPALRSRLARAEARTGSGTEDGRAAALSARYHILSLIDFVERPAEGPGSALERYVALTRPQALDEWSDETVLRFVEGLSLAKEGLRVSFRAGVTVLVPCPQPPDRHEERKKGGC